MAKGRVSASKDPPICNLTPAQWKLLFELPADNQIYNVPGVAPRAVHKPKTTMIVEQIVVETASGCVRRRFIRGKWQAVEYVGTTLS